jgi:hypothetical protein
LGITLALALLQLALGGSLGQFVGTLVIWSGGYIVGRWYDRRAELLLGLLLVAVGLGLTWRLL